MQRQICYQSMTTDWKFPFRELILGSLGEKQEHLLLHYLKSLARPSLETI
uniref:Uncharacterized protein n=1 Tax=Anguilla anguilla TaxID=7936 RepID=A0A0E9US95_ANGAN